MGTTVPFPAAPAPIPATEFHRKRWIAAIIIVFILGVLLGWWLHKCPKPANNGGGGTGAASTVGTGSPAGPGSPIKLGKGSGDPADGGAGNGGGDIKGGGAGGGDGSGDADLPGGPNPPGGKPDSAPHVPGAEASGRALQGTLIQKLAGGDSPTGNAEKDSGYKDPPAGPVLTAQDFSYDSTGLPRYASGVEGVASGVATDTIRHKKSTMAAIVTNDSFDSVVTWYKSQVPAGWHAQSMGDMQAVAKAMSPDAIMGMLSGASNGKPVDTASISAAINGSGDQSVAIFNPPNQTADPRSIMISKQKGKSTQIMMSKKLQP